MSEANSEANSDATSDAHRISRRRVALGLAAACTGSAWAQAGDWPAARTITWIVPFPPGGSNDVAARLLAETLREPLRQQVVVDNRPGANGSLGAQAAARARRLTATPGWSRLTRWPCGR